MSYLNVDRAVQNLENYSVEQVSESFVNYIRPIYKANVNTSKLSPKADLLETFPNLRDIFKEISLLPIEAGKIRALIIYLKSDARIQRCVIREYN